MMTYKETMEYIHQTTWRGSRPGLSRIRELLAVIGNPQNAVRCIHIAGTNGKGSVSAMTASILRAAGYKTGLFVSPYIKHFSERIQFDGNEISEDDLCRITDYIRPFADAMSDPPTEFELITAIGFLYFKEKQCDVVVLETGMGGRLDSTNIIKNPYLTVITGIALDHTKILGDTIEKIAAEKAGIIKPNCPMLFGGKDSVARNVIEQYAKEADVPFLASADTKTLIESMTLEGTVLSYEDHKHVHIPLLGWYQPMNASTVLKGIDILRTRGLTIPESAVTEGMKQVRWTGRFEKLSKNPLIIYDGAHNPEGVGAAVESLKTYFPGQKLLLVSGVMADKDHSGMVKELAPFLEEVYTLTPANPRALNADSFAEEFNAAGIPATPFQTVYQTMEHAITRAKETGKPLICLGSLYMYEELTDALESILKKGE